MKKKRVMALAVALMLSALLCFSAAVSRLAQNRQAESKQQLEEALRRTAVACYASEGMYPPNLEYMKNHYGLTFDETQYTVRYQVFASNLMPDITVLEKTK